VRLRRQEFNDMSTRTYNEVPCVRFLELTLTCIRRWKDTLLGCFKAGRYRHLLNTHVKINGKNVYRLVMPLAHDAQAQQK
jgi:hypothetical protein